ncbi:hypothetical protein AB0K09_00445 [Streptomyces sp. NPDC049577]|uniref:hypothetical protein n=1 Tax=Streptomyces sp. NPDC049577 TaxID=3155153 RepID=UPI00341BFCDF
MTPTPGIPETFAGPGAPTEGALSLADVRKRIQRPRQHVDMVMDAEAADEIDVLAKLLEKAKQLDEQTNEPDRAPALARRLRALEEQAEASTVTFVLQAISHRHYARLQTEHPPTEAQIAEAHERGGDGVPAFDPDSFAPALVRAQMLSPTVGSEQEFAAFWDDLSDGQMRELWMTALSVQVGVTELGPKSESASEILRSFGLS